jgi:hypothetical protein
MRLSNVHLRERADIFRWSLKHDGQFSVGSMYQACLDLDIVPISLKIKVFFVAAVPEGNTYQG